MSLERPGLDNSSSLSPVERKERIGLLWVQHKTHMQIGTYGSALDCVKDILKLDPGNADATRMLVDLEQELRDRQSGRLF